MHNMSTVVPRTQTKQVWFKSNKLKQWRNMFFRISNQKYNSYCSTAVTSHYFYYWLLSNQWFFIYTKRYQNTHSDCFCHFSAAADRSSLINSYLAAGEAADRRRKHKVTQQSDDTWRATQNLDDEGTMWNMVQAYADAWRRSSNNVTKR